MFFHNFKYSLKTLFKNRMLIFWTFAFPIILGTLFNMAFKDIESSEQLDIIDIAIVENEQFNNNEMYKEIFNNLSDKNNEDRLFNINYTTKEEASKLLEDEKVSGYLIYEDGFKIFVKTSGINETILKTVTEEIKGLLNTPINLSKDESFFILSPSKEVVYSQEELSKFVIECTTTLSDKYDGRIYDS